MKVLITHELFPPDYAGGGEYGVLEIARNLIRAGATVQVLTTGNPAQTSHEGISTVRLPIHRYQFNLAVRRIIGMARDADLIQTFNYHACLPSLMAGKYLRKPVVCTFLGLFHDAWLEMRGPVAGRMYRAWERFLVTRKFARICFLSEPSRNLGLSLGVHPQDSFANPPGISADEYQAAEPKDDLVLFVGKLEARKGVYDVVRAAAALPSVRFQMIGWGPEEGNLHRVAPPNLELIPFENGTRLRSAYARAAIFLLPSRAEGFPKAILEAMASGCAVISSVPLGFEGAVVPPGDIARLVAAIEALRSDPRALHRLGKRNLELARNYTWQGHVSLLLRAYEDVLRSPR